MIWESATSIEPDTVGIAVDSPTVRVFTFVAIRDVRLGEDATALNLRGDSIVGRVVEVTANNRSFPRMGQMVWLAQGYSGASNQRGAVEIPD